MKLDTELTPFTFDGSRPFRVADNPTKIQPPYSGKKDYRKKLDEFADEIDELQQMMYAHDRHGALLIFQAMDAAGKDGTIRAVMRGINPHGVAVSSFKKPSDEELDHGYLWRTNLRMPRRGQIGIFNRSYYEEVLICRVHPEIVTRYQRLPEELTGDLDALWERRYEEIRNLEKYQADNGTRTLKFFLNISRDEQRDRFLSRIDEPSKNWKFAEGDVKERAFWDDYMSAYERAINATATPHAPWFVIPGDDKKTMRLIVAKIILQHLRSLGVHYPEVDDARRAELQKFREALAAD